MTAEGCRSERRSAPLDLSPDNMEQGPELQPEWDSQTDSFLMTTFSGKWSLWDSDLQFKENV